MIFWPCLSLRKDIPCIVVQGRYDCVCPVSPLLYFSLLKAISDAQMRAAWDLREAWGDKLRLYVVDDAGHSAHEPGTKRLLVGAADEFVRTLQW